MSPFSIEKKLGKAYNQACEIIPSNHDWICFIDGDAMFLNSNWGEIIYNAIEKHSNTYSAFTCYASRTGGISQRYNRVISEERDILVHKEIAENNAVINHGKIKDISYMPFISGHLILFPKWLWAKIKFVENTPYGGILGIDNVFFFDIISAGYKVGVIEDLYLLHYYRLNEGKNFTEHLR